MGSGTTSRTSCPVKGSAHRTRKKEMGVSSKPNRDGIREAQVTSTMVDGRVGSSARDGKRSCAPCERKNSVAMKVLKVPLGRVILTIRQAFLRESLETPQIRGGCKSAPGPRTESYDTWTAGWHSSCGQPCHWHFSPRVK